MITPPFLPVKTFTIQTGERGGAHHEQDPHDMPLKHLHAVVQEMRGNCRGGTWEGRAGEGHTTTASNGRRTSRGARAPFPSPRLLSCTDIMVASTAHTPPTNQASTWFSEWRTITNCQIITGTARASCGGPTVRAHSHSSVAQEEQGPRGAPRHTRRQRLSAERLGRAWPYPTRTLHNPISRSQPQPAPLPAPSCAHADDSAPSHCHNMCNW